MKKFIIPLLLILGLAAPVADAAKGTIALVNDDKIVVRVDGLLEQYTMGSIWGSVWNFQSGDEIFGVEDSYGRQTWYNRDRDREFDVYVDKFWADAEDAMDYFSR